MSGDLRARLRGRRGALALDVELHAAAGAVTALSGASGAGKTTLLRALAGLERLAGEVRLGPETWQDGRRFVPPHRRRVGYVVQQGALLPHLSVRGNLLYALRRSGGEHAALDAASARFGLGDLLGRAPDRLSGGERQRVAIARALLTRPRLLLLDEPLAGLDAEARARLLPELRSALAELGAAAIYVSHDPAEAAALGAAAHLRLERGRLHAVAAAQDPLARFSVAELRSLAAAALAAGITPQG